jgi:CBS-domain-containing membrane protein
MRAKVADVMTTKVVAVREGATFKEIAARLQDEHISAFPVIDDDNKVIGVVSAADLLAKEAVAGDSQNFTGPLAGLLHRQELEKARGVTARELMYDRRVKRLPVVDSAGRLAGIVSRTDVLSVFSRPDDEILNQITSDVILDTYLMDPLSFRVAVKDGVVTMSGDPESALVGHEIIDTIRHVEGVVAVRDRLDYPSDEPVHTFGPSF